jgi:hypothetical protein
MVVNWQGIKKNIRKWKNYWKKAKRDQDKLVLAHDLFENDIVIYYIKEVK